MNESADTEATKRCRKERLFTGNWHFDAFYALLLLAMASLPFTNWLMLPIAVLMFLNWIIAWNWKEKIRNLKENVSPVGVVVLFSLYALVIYGFFLSSNKAHAFAAFDCNLWFLAAPLFALAYSRKDLNRTRIRIALLVFALFTFLHLCVIFGIAIAKYIRTDDSYGLFYIHLSLLRHPSYLAMYVTFSFCIVLEFLSKEKERLSSLAEMFVIFVLAVFAVSVFFLQSKAGILIFLLVGALWVVNLWIIRTVNIAAVLSILVCVGSVVVVLNETGDLPIRRFQASVEDIEQFRNQELGDGSTEIRLTVWKSALEICRKNMPWGVGTGDATDELCLNAIHQNYTNLIGHHFNAHNQYLQTLLTVGIPGVLALLCYCGFPFVVSFKRRDFLYLSFAVIVVLNLAAESMFETRAGVDFIALMNVLLLLKTQVD